MANKNKNNITPIWESPLLNVEEASDYFHIGVNMCCGLVRNA